MPERRKSAKLWDRGMLSYHWNVPQTGFILSISINFGLTYLGLEIAEYTNSNEGSPLEKKDYLHILSNWVEKKSEGFVCAL